MKKNISVVLATVIWLGAYTTVSAEPTDTTPDHSQPSTNQPFIKHGKGPVAERTKKEEKVVPNSFAIAFYKPTYILPVYYTGSPYNSVYLNNTPNNESLKHNEMKYQFSVKVPVWKNIFDSYSSLYFAYTQLSYWQLYNKRAFFRETDYEPEVFLQNEVKWKLNKDWQINFLNVGATHQSNGYGNQLERSWNRAYLEAIASSGNWMISVKPWYVLSTYSTNKNIANYLGYGRLLVAYKFHQHVVSLQAYNVIESGGKRAGTELTWSFPLTSYIKGYVQAFSGYGQSLIEYDHRTNSIGLGVALSDWI